MTTGGGAVASGNPAELGGEFDFARLERAVTALAERQVRLETENSELRHGLQEKTLRAADLEERLLDANQRRRDAAKRIDGLISQVAQIEASFEPRSA
jgi:chromosome segregation ATPase